MFKLPFAIIILFNDTLINEFIKVVKTILIDILL